MSSLTISFQKMNSFVIKKYIEIDENNVNWSDIEIKVRTGARSMSIIILSFLTLDFSAIVICADFYDIYSSLYNIGIRQLGGYRFFIVVILNKPPDEVLNQPNIKNLLYGANTFIVSEDDRND